MFNIEQKIKNYYKKQNNVPLVKEINEEENEKVVSQYSTKSNKDNVIVNRKDLLNKVADYNSKINQIKAEIEESEKDEDEDDKYGLTDEEILNKAQESAEEIFKPDYLKEDLKNSTNNRKLNNKKQEILYNQEYEKNKIDENFDIQVENQSNDAIKKGISRSSIFDEALKDLETKRKAGKDEVDKKTEKEVLESENLIEDEKKRHDIAIEGIDAKKTEKINSIVKELKKDRLNKINSGQLLNPDFKGSEGMPQEVADLYKEMLDLVVNYYRQMDKNTAKTKYREDEELHKLLGDLEGMARVYITGTK